MIVTLNPKSDPDKDKIHASYLYDHPVFDTRAIMAQEKLWSIQGEMNTWFCGAWLGYGFHEDGLQSGLAIAEALGDLKRPWQVENPNGRIATPPKNSRYHNKVAA